MAPSPSIVITSLSSRLSSSLALAIIFHLCSPNIPAARTFRFWIPISCVICMPLGKRIWRRNWRNDNNDYQGEGYSQNGMQMTENKNGRGELGEGGNQQQHACGNWVAIGVLGGSFGIGLTTLVASAAGGALLDVLSILSLASPLLRLLASPHPNSSSQFSLSALLLFLTSTLIYISPSPPISSAFQKWGNFDSAGVVLAGILVLMRVGVPTWGLPALGGRGNGIGACNGCDMRIQAVAAVTALLTTMIINPFTPPPLKPLHIALMLLVSFLLSFSPPSILLQPTHSSSDSNQETQSDNILTELGITTALLAIEKGLCKDWTVHVMLFALGSMIIHLLGTGSADVALVLPSSASSPTGPDSKMSSSQEASTGSARRRYVYLGLACVPLVLWMGKIMHLTGLGVGGGNLGKESLYVRASTWRRDVDYELAIAHYSEPRDVLSGTIKDVKSRLPSGSTSRTTVYSKGPESKVAEDMKGLMVEVGADAVIALENVGREGETYLQHIVRNYNSSTTPLAGHTLFLQPHIAWGDVAYPRLDRLRTHPETAFVSLGPYLNATCTEDGNEKDSHGMSFGRIPQIYAAFNGDLCPASGFAITWAGQFLVSRQRILGSPQRTYQNLLDYFDVPKNEGYPKDWIWNEGWWNSQPSDPTHGHWLERSWPAIFRCSRPQLAWDCGFSDKPGPECECVDE